VAPETDRTPILPALRNRTAVVETPAAITIVRPTVNVPAGVLITIALIAGAGIFAIAYLLFVRNRNKETGTGRENTAGEESRHATLVPVMPGRVPDGEHGFPRNGPDAAFPASLEKRFLNPEFIGEGGIARVFRAKNAKTGKTVAVKVPQRFDEMTGTHFTRDIFFWQGLGHENIIGIYSTNILPVPYVEMEYAPSSLARMKLPLPEPEALAIVTGVVRGLAFAHGKGIVHRDLKPENILIAEDGTPKITDWGLGKRVNDPRQSTMIGYSPGYAAPEQVAPQIYGKPGAATDIYQVGVLFTELLTGTNPFAREGIHDTNMAILNDPAGEPSWDGRHVPEIRAIIRKCLARRPEDRYSSAADLLTDLEAVGRGAE
jgi:serine/threonine protein kinase